MKRHRKYLAAKFKALKPELDALNNAGGKLNACSACGFKAAIATKLAPKVATLRCHVCDHIQTAVKIACPHCEKHVVVTEGYSECNYCGKPIEPADLIDQLLDHDAAHTAAKDGDDSYGPINCGSCEDCETVVELDGGEHFCANCFDLSEQITQCGWCGAYSTGMLRDSFANGCGQCEGHWGHTKDD